ncbi:MAG: hypothetical protein EXR70_03470 [Deltaproteobacteria bacterium]|nr:hypothetical protein [Deltaproteobacteria bacterium]
MMKKFLLPLCAGLLLALPALAWLVNSDASPRQEPVQALSQYLRFLYARDFRQAYRFISADDQGLKNVNDYVRERGSFSGFTLALAARLAGLIEVNQLASVAEGPRQRVTVAMKLPDANSIAPLLHDWDDKKLNALSAPARRNLLSTIDKMIGAGKLPMIEGEEKFVLSKEGSKWKVFLDWAAGVQVQFSATVPGNAISATALSKSTVARSGDLFTVGFKVVNRSAKEIVTRIAHRVEPQEFAQYLDLVECALLLPVRIQPGEEQIYRSTYSVRGDLPDGTKLLNVTYEFKIEN